MKICFVIDKLGVGGAERVMTVLANEMIKKGHSVFLIEASVETPSNFYFLDPCVTHINNLRANKQGVFKKINFLRKTFKTITPEIVVSFKYMVNFYTHVALFGLHIPHVMSERNNPYTYSDNFIAKHFKKLFYKMAQGTVFQTQMAQDFYFPKKRKNNSCVIPNPVLVAEDIYRPQNLQFEKAFVSVGRLAEQKNFPLVINAFSKFVKIQPDYCLKIFGEGPLKNDLLELAKQKKVDDKVIFKGNSDTWHKEIIKDCAFIMSSNYEGMPNALMESLALGVPSISTDCPCGGPAFLIKNRENGLLIEPNNEDELVEAMLTITEESMQEKFREANRGFRSKFSISAITDLWIDFFGTLL